MHLCTKNWISGNIRPVMISFQRKAFTWRVLIVFSGCVCSHFVLVIWVVIQPYPQPSPEKRAPALSNCPPLRCRPIINWRPLCFLGYNAISFQKIRPLVGLQRPQGLIVTALISVLLVGKVHNSLSCKVTELPWLSNPYYLRSCSNLRIYKLLSWVVLFCNNIWKSLFHIYCIIRKKPLFQVISLNGKRCYPI